MGIHPARLRTLEDCVARLVPELDVSVAPLRTCLEILRLDRGAQGAAETERRRIESHLAQLLALADDLSALNVIRQGRMRVSKARVRLATVVGLALEMADPVIDNAGCMLQVDIPPTPVWLDADHLRLGQALANLLLNAVNSAPNAGRILLRAIPAGGELEVTQVLHPVPERSLRLGVTISRVIVQMHGGTVSGSGSESGSAHRFTLRLPCGAGALDRGGRASRT